MFITGQLEQVKQRSFIAIGSGVTTLTCAQIPFKIPREARFISFILVGPGGGAAGGVTGAITTSRRGGGGGGGGAVTTAIYNTRTLPESLYLILPGGGLGGNANANGNTSAQAQITLAPARSNNQAINILSASPGAIGLVTGAGGAGGAASVLNSTVCTIFPLSYNSVTGGNGSGSGNAAATSDALMSIVVGIGGLGGGSTNLGTPFAGGRLVTNATAGLTIFNLPGSTPLNVGGTNTGGAGINGYHNIDNTTPYGDAALPMYSIPGSGGGAIDSGTGGAGGNGAPGCGGSGGGAGTTGGVGGNGGPSFCIVEWW